MRQTTIEISLFVLGREILRSELCTLTYQSIKSVVMGTKVSWLFFDYQINICMQIEPHTSWPYVWKKRKACPMHNIQISLSIFKTSCVRYVLYTKGAFCTFIHVGVLTWHALHVEQAKHGILSHICRLGGANFFLPITHMWRHDQVTFTHLDSKSIFPDRQCQRLASS